ncbi:MULTISPECIES: WbqC family protein [unclassified Dysgonomonas]|uniref:WbqC family protein n=1 Tax=unclassified Dysgonomonas TaxID=2630389 RepID=UPI002473F96E|nr:MULTISPECIES: WbqC family protein [unclassified Dysgonomonas]
MDIWLSTAYLAPIQYYSKMLCADKVWIERYDNYEKQTYRNRCTILSANGPIALSIPVEHPQTQKSHTKDIRIADHGNWRHIHWNALVSAYNSTPFFEYYRDDFQPLYEKKYTFLIDFNDELHSLISSLIGFDKTPLVSYTDSYKESFFCDEYDFRSAIHPKKKWEIADPGFASVPYYQVFEQRFGFVPNLSIVDLLFNMGNESLLILSECCQK